MGSVPTQTFKADLNGTGTLVDVSTYVAENVFEHKYGRTDWTQQVQAAGTLTVTLENNDGRFTPASTAVYLVGVVRNMVVEWTCGARVRRFYVRSSALGFGNGMAGQSTVTLTCTDALGLLAERSMVQMVREAVRAAKPVGYWPMDESSSDGLTFRDISGNAQPALYPFTKVPGSPIVWGTGTNQDQINPGGGRGPRTDGVGALQLNGTTTTPIPTATETLGCARNLLVTDGSPIEPGRNRQIKIADLATPISNTPAFPMSGWNKSGGGALEYVVSFWFSIKDIYGGTSSTTLDTDGPYVYLLGIEQAPGEGIHVMWRIPDRKLVVATSRVTNGIRQLSTDAYSVSPTDVHHLALVISDPDVNWNGGVYYGVQATLRGYLDGQTLSPCSISTGYSVTFRPIGILVGRPPDYFPTRTGTNKNIYALSGTISNISIHGPDQVGGTVTWSLAQGVWDTGTTGPLEDASARFSRVGAWSSGTVPATLAFSPQGTPQVALLGPHDTSGKSMLQVLCEVLACEEASLDTIVSGGVDTVRAWLDTYQRTLTPALTIDAQDDAADTPDLDFDLTGVVSTATAKTWGQSAAYTDTAAASKWMGASAEVVCAVVDSDALKQFAVYRTAKGRAVKISPTRVVVNAAGSKANVTAALLALYPGATVRVQGLPSSQIGYSQIDCILIGVDEKHGNGYNNFELTLIPRTAELYTDPLLGTEGPWRMIDEPDWSVSPVNGYVVSSGWTGAFMLLAGTTTGGTLSSGATTGYILSNPYQGPSIGAGGSNTVPSTLFSQDAADFPVSIKVDNEIITLPNPAGTPTAVTINATPNCWYQQVTGMLRGQQGTTAASHAGGPLTALSEDQHLTVVVPAEYAPLLAF